MPNNQVDDVLSCYLERKLAGAAEPLEQFLASHSNLASELSERLAILEEVGALEPSPPVYLQPGETIVGDYRIDAVLGRGGMACVYRATQLSLGREVALKVASHPAFTERQRARYRHEARTLARLQHAHIVKIFGSGFHRQTPYLVMELVRGRGFDQIDTVPATGPGRSDIEAIVRIAIRLARALAHCHSNGVIHRDVKPANILLHDDQPVLVDFGLAQDDSRDRLTLSGEFLGTLCFTAPEQALGQPIDQRVDVFGLGATLCDVLVGETPYSAKTLGDLVRLVSEREPRDPASMRPRLPRDLAIVLAMACARRPRDRYASCVDLAEDLEAFLEGRPVAATRPSAWTRGVRWARRRPAVVAAGVGLTAALALAAVVVEEKHRSALARTRLHAEQQDRADQQRIDELISMMGHGMVTEESAELDPLCERHPSDPAPWVIRVLLAVRPVGVGPLYPGALAPEAIQAGLDRIEKTPAPVRHDPAIEVCEQLLVAWRDESGDGLDGLVASIPETPQSAMLMTWAAHYLGAPGSFRSAFDNLDPSLGTYRDHFIAASMGAPRADGGRDGLIAAATAVGMNPDNPFARWVVERYAFHMAIEDRDRVAQLSLQRVEQQVLPHAANSPLVLHWLAYMYTESKPTGWIEKAEHLYRTVLRDHPLAVTTQNLVNLLRSTLDQRDREEALAEIGDLLASIEPAKSMTKHYWIERAWSHFQWSDFQTSVALLQQGLGRVPITDRAEIADWLLEYSLRLEDRRVAPMRQALEVLVETPVGDLLAPVGQHPVGTQEARWNRVSFILHDPRNHELAPAVLQAWLAWKPIEEWPMGMAVLLATILIEHPETLSSESAADPIRARPPSSRRRVAPSIRCATSASVRAPRSRCCAGNPAGPGGEPWLGKNPGAASERTSTPA